MGVGKSDTNLALLMQQPTSMQKAARFHAARKVMVDDVPLPTIKPGSVIVKVEYCGICGTDLHEYTDGPILGQLCPHPQFGEELPIVMGHEFSGTITEVGQGVSPKWTTGQRVIVEPLRSCMSCGECLEGMRNLCSQAAWMGCMGSGGLCEYILIDEAMLHALPDNVSFEAGAMVEPFAVAHHAIKRSGLKKGQTCLVMGAGPIGALLLKGLAALEVGWIAVAEPSELRAQTAKRLGAHAVYDPTKTDVVAECKKHSSGRGVHVVFDAAGYEPAIATAFESVRPKGTVVNIATWTRPPQIDVNRMILKELSYIASQAYANEHAEVIELLASEKIVLDDLVTARVPLVDIVPGALEVLLNEKEKHIKILVKP